MEQIYATATLWLALAVVAAVVAFHLRISIALVEICTGVAATAAAAAFGHPGMPGTDQEWLRFLATTGAVLLTFLAGAELDPVVLRTKLREVTAVGVVGFVAPFFGCTAVAYYGLGWGMQASWLCGVVLSTSSTAVVYSVMLDTGLNTTGFGKGVLGACFINDLATVVVLGLLFAPFGYRTAVLIAVGASVLALLPTLTARITRVYGHRTAAIRTKWVMLVLFGLGALAFWAGSEAVLPAYIAGMALAGGAARDAFWLRRLRTLTVGFLTPFYFLRAGTLVSLNALWAAPLVVPALLAGKIVSKIFGLYPVVARFRDERSERWYYTLLMSTGLTFGTIAALYGLAHGIVTREQYSFLVAAVIASAVVPTLIAGIAFLPVHLLPTAAQDRSRRGADGNGAGREG